MTGPYLGPKRRYDIPGALLLTAGMLLLVRTIVEAPATGWGEAETIGGFALSLALLAAFVAVERRTSQPLVRLGIFRSAPLVRANLGAMCLFGAYVGFQFVATLYLQRTLGWSALETALAFLPGGLLVAFGAPRMGAVISRYGTTRPILASTIAFAAGYALFLPVDANPYWLTFLPVMLLVGLGFALGYAALNVQATAGVADHEQGLAAGLVQTSFQMGGAIVLAAVSAVVGAGSTGDYRTAIAVVLGVAVVSIVLALTSFVRARGRTRCCARRVGHEQQASRERGAVRWMDRLASSGGPLIGLPAPGRVQSDRQVTGHGDSGRSRPSVRSGCYASIPSVVALLEHHRAVELAHSWGCARFASTTARQCDSTPRARRCHRPAKRSRMTGSDGAVLGPRP